MSIQQNRYSMESMESYEIALKLVTDELPSLQKIDAERVALQEQETRFWQKATEIAGRCTEHESVVPAFKKLIEEAEQFGQEKKKEKEAMRHMERLLGTMIAAVLDRKAYISRRTELQRLGDRDATDMESFIREQELRIVTLKLKVAMNEGKSQIATDTQGLTREARIEELKLLIAKHEETKNKPTEDYIAETLEAIRALKALI